MRKTSAAIAAMCLAAALPAKAAEPFAVTSSAFKDGGVMALKYAGKNPASATCVGENVSPALSWSNPPEGVKSYAVVMQDPEGGKGLGVIHWVAYGIPGSATGLTEGEASAPSQRIVGGTNNQGLTIYIGPCPPVGGYHHYMITVIATDLEPGALPPGLNKADLIGKLNGHALGAAGIVGLFRHP